MKKYLALILGLLLAVSVLAGCAPKSETPATPPAETPTEQTLEPLKLVVAHNQTSTENPYQYGMLKFKEVVEQVSGGNITVTVHNGSIGTNESELIEKLSLGAADMVVASPGFMTAIGVNEVDMLSLLYLFNSFDHWEKALDGEFGGKMKDIITEKTNNEFKIMGFWSSSVRNYYGKAPINVPQDAKGFKIRTQSSPVQQQFWANAGAIPTSVAWGELYQALQQGVVDAAENDYTNFMLQDHHKTKNGMYVSETMHDYTTRLLLMNGDRFDALPDQQKAWILEAVEAATAEERAVTYRMLEESKAKVIADGGVVNEVNLEAFRELAIPIQDKYAADNGMEELLDLVRAIQ